MALPYLSIGVAEREGLYVEARLCPICGIPKIRLLEVLAGRIIYECDSGHRSAEPVS